MAQAIPRGSDEHKAHLAAFPVKVAVKAEPVSPPAPPAPPANQTKSETKKDK
jgi:hypothetical protein